MELPPPPAPPPPHHCLHAMLCLMFDYHHAKISTDSDFLYKIKSKLLKGEQISISKLFVSHLKGTCDFLCNLFVYYFLT